MPFIPVGAGFVLCVGTAIWLDPESWSGENNADDNNDDNDDDNDTGDEDESDDRPGDRAGDRGDLR